MEDQGFDELEDLIHLAQDDAEFKEMVPALGHRTKIKRLLGLVGGSAAGSGEVVTPVTPVTASSLPSQPLPRSTSSSNALLDWLKQHDLEVHAARIQGAGYDAVADLSALIMKPDLFELLVPVPGHRDRIRRVLAPVAPPVKTTEWLKTVKPPEGPDADLISIGDGGSASQQGDGTREAFQQGPLKQLLSAVGSQFIRTASPATVSPPREVALLSGGKPEVLICASDESSDERRSDDAARKRKKRGEDAGAKKGGASGNVRRGEGDIFVKELDRWYDPVCFVSNSALSAAGCRTVPMCMRAKCADPERCDQLHFKELTVRHEHLTKTVSAMYVSQVTSGLLSYFRGGTQKLLPCLDDCGNSSCHNLHATFPNSFPPPPPEQWTPLRDWTMTDAFVRVMERPYPLHDRKSLDKVKVCPAFSLTQTCDKGSKCWNFHCLPPSFCRYFYQKMPMDKLTRHCKSLNHLPSEQWDAAQRIERCKTRSFDVGEALDFMLRTHCRPCSVIFFDAFRIASKRQGANLLWSLLSRMHGDPKDPALQSMLTCVNNILQLPHNEKVTLTSPVEHLLLKIYEAVMINVRRSLSSSGPSPAQGSQKQCYVFWDFDNILFSDRTEITLFFHCLCNFFTREGYASSKGCVHVKAFGTQHSYDDETVDALRDMGVEMVLCSSKKQEETDRQMERSMRAFEGKPNTTVSILSSDKDFMSAAKDLSRSGTDVVVLHCADHNSNHESMLHFSSHRSVHLFDVYQSALAPPSKAPAAAKSALPVQPPLPSAVAFNGPSAAHSSASPAFVDPAVLGSGPVVTSLSKQPPQTQAQKPDDGGKRVLDFFTKSSKSLPHEGAINASDFESQLLSNKHNNPSRTVPGSLPTSGVAIPHPRSQQLAEASPKPQTHPTSSASAPSRSLLDMVQPPGPPREHRAWYQFFVDSFLVRLEDRRRGGDARGPFVPNTSEDSIRREIRVYLEMASLVDGLLPSWFNPDTAFRLMYRKIMDELPEDWMSDDHFLSLYAAEQFHQVFIALRYIASLIEGPVGNEIVAKPTDRLRLQLH